MRFVILRLLTHSELGMFHEYRRQKKEGSKQRAINFDWDVVDRVFPAAKDHDKIIMTLRYDSDGGVAQKQQWLKRQDKNWRLEGNCPTDKCYSFVEPNCLFAMEIDAGQSPAVGSWAVFPKDDHVTKLILADGESSRLVKSAMIALHDNEGLKTWETLTAARPDLFSGRSDKKKSSQSVGRAVTKRNGGGVELPPNPKRLVKILASVGHTLPSAVADLVDNSISADATKIEITFGRPDDGHGRWMAISDNGRGMSESKLTEAMRIGSDADYEANSLGKYGYGLKGASWSQTDVFTVVTKERGKNPRHLTWDIDNMEGWMAQSDPMEPWEEAASQLEDSGTVVLWKNMRPPQTMTVARGVDPYSAEIMALERHLALVFHRFLEGTAAGRKRVKLSINGKPVEPNNPVGHPLVSAYDAKTIRIPTEAEDGRVKVQAFLLPSEQELDDHHKKDGPEAVRRAHELIGLYGKRNETQGLFIYRHDRLIKWGGWHQMWETNDEKTKLARVTVDFDKNLDDSFKINISKQIVQLSQQLQVNVKKIADEARKDSQRKYRKPKGAAGGVFPPTKQPVASGPPPSSPPLAGPAVPTPIAPIRIAVKTVNTQKFVWKVTAGLTGARDVQVSEVNKSLHELVKKIEKDREAVAHLADFLGELDALETQKALLKKADQK